MDGRKLRCLVFYEMHAIQTSKQHGQQNCNVGTIVARTRSVAQAGDGHMERRRATSLIARRCSSSYSSIPSSVSEWSIPGDGAPVWTLVRKVATRTAANGISVDTRLFTLTTDDGSAEAASARDPLESVGESVGRAEVSWKSAATARHRTDMKVYCLLAARNKTTKVLIQ